MAFLLIFKKDRTAFVDCETFDKLAVVGVHDLLRDSMPGATITGHFQHGDDAVLIELKSDMQTFAISDSSPAGFEFAVRLQAQFEAPLRIVNEAYTFDLELKGFKSAEELLSAIRSVSE